MMDCQVKPGNDAVCPGRSAALQSRGPDAETVTGVPVLRSSASQELRAASRPGHDCAPGNDENQLNTTTKPTTIRQQPINAIIGQLVRGRS